jgi:hypothetical protein
MIPEPWLSIISWSVAIVLVSFLIFWTPRMRFFRHKKKPEIDEKNTSDDQNH